MKKALLIIIVLTLFCVLSFTAFADDSDLVLNAKKKEIPIGTSFKLKVKNYTGKVSFRSSNPKITKVSANGKITAKKPGKATITAKVNGKAFKCKVTSKVALKITYKFKKKVKINVGQSKKIKNLYKYTTNLKYLKKYVSNKKYKKFKKQVDKKAKSPKAKIKNTKVAKVVDNKVINGKKKGKTKVVVSCGKQSFDVGVDVTKLTETTFKGEKAKVAYSADEFYKLYQDQVMKYIIKGEDPKDYKYILCNFKKMSSPDSVREIIVDCLEKYYDNPNYFYDFEGAGYDVFQQNGKSAYGKYYKTAKGPFYIKIEAINKSENKKLYNAAKKILDSININSFKEDYEKIAALHYWFNENCTFGDCAYDGLLESEKTIIYKHKGVCTDHALATNYFCALLKIPSINNNGMVNASHEWNYIKIGSKWYHTDNLNGILLVGSTELAEWNNKFKCFGLYDDEINRMWNKRISKTSFEISKEKRNEILTKMGYNTY